MAVSIAIKDQIIDKIDALSSVEVVYPAVRLNAKGWPAVCVTANTMEGEFSSTAQNSRLYTYNCMIYFPIGQDFVPEDEKDRMDYAERTIAEVINQIINAIDTDYELEGGDVLFVNAADVEWGYVDIENGAARAANVVLRVYTEVTVSS